jgi:hypothetical protein
MVLAMFTLLLTASLSITPSPSIAEEICRDIGFVPPSETTRLVKFDKFGIQIKIPSNFRTMLLNDSVSKNIFEFEKLLNKYRVFLYKPQCEEIFRQQHPLLLTPLFMRL